MLIKFFKNNDKFCLKNEMTKTNSSFKNRAALQHIKRIGENIAKILHEHTNVLKPLAPIRRRKN